MHSIKILAILLVLFVASCSGKRSETKNSSTGRNDLPTMTILKTDGSMVMTKQIKGKTILVLFQPDCDHCQREATQIRQHLDAFREYTLYFISADALGKIASFASEYGLTGHNNIHFATVEAQYIINNFGPIDAPSLYIYNDAGKLVKKFNGETDIALIVNSL